MLVDEANTTELDTSSSSSVDLEQKKEKKNWSEDEAKLLMFHRSLSHEEFESRATGHEALGHTFFLLVLLPADIFFFKMK